MKSCFTISGKGEGIFLTIQPFSQTFSNQILPITQDKRFFLFLLLR